MLGTGAKLIARMSVPTRTADRMPPRLSTGSVGLVHVRRHEPPRHEEGDGRERQRDQEDRSPVEALEEETRHERAEGRDGATEGRPQGDRLRSPGPGSPECGDEGKRGRDRPCPRRCRRRSARRSGPRSSARTPPPGRLGSRARYRAAAASCGRSGPRWRRARARMRPSPASTRPRRDRALSATP